MRIAVMGAGGIGGFYGGLLARVGHDVTLIARGPHLAALQRDGLTVKRDAEAFTVRPVQATGDPERVGAVDLVLVATKAYDLDAAVQSMRPLVGSATLVLPLLNGVDIPERVARHIPARQTLLGVTYLPANRPRPGVVHQPGEQQRMIFGEVDAPVSERCRSVLAILTAAGIRAEVSDTMRLEAWRKLMLVAANGGVCAVLGKPTRTVLGNAETCAVYEAACAEVHTIANAQSIPLPFEAVAETMAHAARMPEGNKPSMLQDLEAGRPLELEVLSGTLVRLGREHNVPVPVHTFIHAALKLRAGGNSNG